MNKPQKVKIFTAKTVNTLEKNVSDFVNDELISVQTPPQYSSATISEGKIEYSAFIMYTETEYKFKDNKILG